MTGTCACGAVSVTLDRSPDFIHDCDCSLCRKTGAAWGYFGTAQVTISGETIGFQRADKPTPTAVLRSCRTCGTTTHFELSPATRTLHPELDQVGVNMKLFAPDALTGVEVRFPDGAGWSGEGSFGYRRDALTIGTAQVW
ncbi:MAG: aldehyde-activating protein [Pseudomonadota bacterium]